ncbi:stage II sporulation protein M [Brevibacillus sp. B_LB10_24]|uniref:stage II sporulation protein M n=1 Tax=Brevibacillus sp. B_LB10_24 TaxID=3380645 RepID=UPI0038B9AE29
MHRRVGQTVRSYMQEHQTHYVFTAVLFAMGIIFGSIVAGSLAQPQKQELFSFIQYFFLDLQEHGVPQANAQFQHSFGYYLKMVGIMWAFGLSVIGLPIILLLLFLKGMMVGFTVGFIVNQLKWQGILFSLAAILPQNMLIVPALLIVGVSGTAFSLRLMRSRFLFKKGEVLPYFATYTATTAGMLAILTIAALFEAFVTPHLMQYMLK